MKYWFNEDLIEVGSWMMEVERRKIGYRKFRRFVCHSERISTKFVEILG